VGISATAYHVYSRRYNLRGVARGRAHLAVVYKRFGFAGLLVAPVAGIYCRCTSEDIIYALGDLHAVVVVEW